MKYLLSMLFLLGMTMSANAALMSSWENSTENWITVDPLTAIASTTTAPAGAITDGTYALELTHAHAANYQSVARLESAFYYADLVANNRMEIDYFVPNSSIAFAGWGIIGLRLEGIIDTTVAHNFTFAERIGGDDAVGTLSFDYTVPAGPHDPGDVGQTQVTIFIQGPPVSHPNNGSVPITLSPFYVDNFRLTTTVPEPTSVALLAMGGMLCGARRRVR